MKVTGGVEKREEWRIIFDIKICRMGDQLDKKERKKKIWFRARMEVSLE